MSDLLKKVPEIKGLSYDSRMVQKGDLFFAIQGATVDGHDFLEEAAKKGAVAALIEKKKESSIPTILVPSVLKSMPSLADEFYHQPSHKIPVVGVTGTNGKTTITYLIEGILNYAGLTCGVMGTINYRFGKKQIPAPNTTPLSLDIQKFLSELVHAKAKAMIMEVSSHALALGRVEGIQFSHGVFTNLTQDHLDFHKDMEDYFQAKSLLFKNNPAMSRIINGDDTYGQRLAKAYPTNYLFGFSNQATLRATDEACTLKGVEFDCVFPSGKKVRVQNQLVGRHNIYNLLAATGACLSLGLDEKTIEEGLNQRIDVPGRLERIPSNKDYVILVDYAHTPDALAKALEALKKVNPRKLVCVFGAGGDRDKQKRPLMGKIACEKADKVFITSDNPRTEDPKQILKDIEMGAKDVGKGNYQIIEDRAQAIQTAIQSAEAGDVVLIAGKGHEDYQIMGRKKIHFSDQEQARKAIR